MEYEILSLQDKTVLHNCRKYRFKDIDSAGRRTNGIWQEKKSNEVC